MCSRISRTSPSCHRTSKANISLNRFQGMFQLPPAYSALKYASIKHNRLSADVEETAIYPGCGINPHSGGEVWQQSLEAVKTHLYRILMVMPSANPQGLGKPRKCFGDTGVSTACSTRSGLDRFNTHAESIPTFEPANTSWSSPSAKAFGLRR